MHCQALLMSVICAILIGNAKRLTELVKSQEEPCSPQHKHRSPLLWLHDAICWLLISLDAELGSDGPFTLRN